MGGGGEGGGGGSWGVSSVGCWSVVSWGYCGSEVEVYVDVAGVDLSVV